jgi:hypothetical protein
LPLRYFAAVRAPELRGSEFRILALNCGGAMGFEPQTSCVPCAAGPVCLSLAASSGDPLPARTVRESPAPSERAAPRWLPRLAPFPVPSAASRPPISSWAAAARTDADDNSYHVRSPRNIPTSQAQHVTRARLHRFHGALAAVSCGLAGIHDHRACRCRHGGTAAGHPNRDHRRRAATSDHYLCGHRGLHGGLADHPDRARSGSARGRRRPAPSPGTAHPSGRLRHGNLKYPTGPCERP